MDDDSRIGARIMGRLQERLLILSVTERAELGRLAGSQSAPHGLVRRAQIILASAGGEANISIADRFGVSNPTVCHWRKKWFEQGLFVRYAEGPENRRRRASRRSA